MATSGTTSFNPSGADAVTMAYARIGIRRPAITTEHLTDALFESNLQMVEMSNLQPLLFKSETLTQALTEGTATYDLPARVVMILIAYVRITGSGGEPLDRVLGPMSTVEYQGIPAKTVEAPPTSYWFNRQVTPQVVLYPVPDGNGPYTLYMQCVSQIEDVALPSGVTLNLPYRYMDAYVSGLSARLARIHKPERLADARAEADRTWNIAATQDVENVPTYILPQVSGYYRGM